MFGPDHPLTKSAKRWVWALAGSPYAPKLSAQCCSQLSFTESLRWLEKDRHMVLEILGALDWAQGLGHSSLELGLKTTGVNAAFICC